MLVYVSGKYTADTPAGIAANIALARRVAIKLWECGFAVICPHLNTYHFERDCNLTHAEYIKGDLRILRGCDAIVMLPGWHTSKGARMELDKAIEWGIPVVYWREANGQEKRQACQCGGCCASMGANP